MLTGAKQRCIRATYTSHLQFSTLATLPDLKARLQAERASFKRYKLSVQKTFRLGGLTSNCWKIMKMRAMMNCGRYLRLMMVR